MSKANIPTSQMTHAEFQKKKCDMFIAAYMEFVRAGFEKYDGWDMADIHGNAFSEAHQCTRNFVEWFCEKSGINDEMNATKYIEPEVRNPNNGN